MQIMSFTASTILLASIFGNADTMEQSINRKTEPSLKGANAWINAQPLTLTELHGKVVLIDFWTFTCINWRRTLPYIRAWDSRYKDQGLVTIGVHTPEFSFEQKFENVNSAIHEMNIHYPVALDKDFEIWNSFQNQYWPALYLIDANGKIRYQKFGESDYAEVERGIQQLLKEAGARDFSDNPVKLQPDGFEVAADWKNLRSPENFIGYERSQGFASPEEAVTEKQAVYSVPAQLKLNQWALSGLWIIGKEGVYLGTGPGKIIYRFHARDLHLIMGRAVPGTPIKFRVMINGKPPGLSHGLDVDSNGDGTVNEQRMYQLVRKQGEITDLEFQIEFFDPQVEVYDFTFG